MSQHILLVGCGDLGIALGQQLLAAGHKVTAVRRDIDKLPEAFHSLAVDVSNSQRCEPLKGVSCDAAVITLTPDSFTDEGYYNGYVQSLKNLLPVWQQQEKPPPIYFVSSTSVYHQSQGEWVDEQSETVPETFSGQRLLEAEQLLIASQLSYSIIRFAGIYGHGRRRLIDQVLAGQGVNPEPIQWTNRIHRDDCIGFLFYLLRKQFNGDMPEPLYIGCDNEPAPMTEVRAWLANELGVELTQQSASPRRSGSKRCSNQGLIASGYQLRYPTYREGYADVLLQLKLKS